ncbi:MAG TPA: hypothetical protein VH108_07625 [Gaiellaceae bacterium]|nr:hypothetical protein [Gaiellaceae bacterium]
MASPFGQLYLGSLIASAEQRVELHRAKGHRLRLRIAARRLRKLQAYEEWRGGPVELLDGRSLQVALLVVSVIWIVLGALLGLVELDHGSDFWVTILLVSLLSLTVVWFRLAVLCVPTTEDQEREGPLNQSTTPGTTERRTSARGGPMPVFEYLRVAGFVGRDGDSYASHVD